MDLDNIEIGKKELGKLIGAAKRVWTGDKTTRISTDKIERNESALFTNDLRLARLAKQKKLLDDEIIDHIDEVLLEHRGYDKDDLQLKKEATILQLFKDVKEELEDKNRLWACEQGKPEEEQPLDFGALLERLDNIIEDLEEGEE